MRRRRARMRSRSGSRGCGASWQTAARRTVTVESSSRGRPDTCCASTRSRVDVTRFERLLTQGRRALAEGDALSAASTLREALALWRGPALADLAPREFAQAEIRRLEELRLGAVMERIEADLALGRAAEAIPELEALVEANPLQERLRGQLMLALYRSARQADALEVYRQTRQLLHDELGLEPSKALQELERSILRQDGSLDLGSRSQAIAARVDDERRTEPGRRRPERDGQILEQDETLVADAARAPPPLARHCARRRRRRRCCGGRTPHERRSRPHSRPEHDRANRSEDERDRAEHPRRPPPRRHRGDRGARVGRERTRRHGLASDARDGGDADDWPAPVGRLPHARRAWERLRVGVGRAVRLADRPAQRHAQQ